ncbi:MAG: ATP F0F1 synthase subunit B [Hyphomicrobiales bacterium]|nr:MAG: ATP F0F1 synthase subunit B [Hyphomicrobiales bacterium]
MAGNTSPIIVVAQAEGDALQQGVVVDEHAVETTTGEVHAEDHSDIFPPFDPSTFSTQLIWLAITFAVLYFMLSRVALPRIGGIIDARKARIEGDLKEAERLRQETDKAVVAYETALAEARKDASKIAEDTRQSIRDDIDGKRKVVEADLGARMSEADARIQASKSVALGSVEAIAAETAQALVAQLGGGATEAEALAAVAEAKGAA